MVCFANLSSKKVFETEILEDWLVDGLGLVYPNLDGQVRKHDAIALILLAVVLNTFKDPAHYENNKELMEQLKKVQWRRFHSLAK